MREREADLYEFVKIRDVGMSVAGRITRYGENENGPFIVMQPIFVQATRGGEWKKYGGAAVGLTTDLRRKVNPPDVGRVLMLTFSDTQPSKQGTPMKMFKVYELDEREVTALSGKAPNLTPGPVNAEFYEQSDDEDALPF